MSSIELVKKDVVQYTAQRVTLTSDKPFQETLAALALELNQDKAGPSLINVLRTSDSKEEFDKGVNAITENGKHDFVFFSRLSHSWMTRYFNGDPTLPESWVITLGNPLIAKDFVKFDVRAGLYVPPRVHVQKTENGGTLVMYDLPSSVAIIDKDAPQEMKDALYNLDAKLERMLTRVLANRKSEEAA